MNNKIENRQITLDKIQKIADFLEDYKEEYDKKFEKDNQKNDKLSYKEKNMSMAMEIAVLSILYMIKMEKQ